MSLDAFHNSGSSSSKHPTFGIGPASILVRSSTEYTVYSIPSTKDLPCSWPWGKVSCEPDVGSDPVAGGGGKAKPKPKLRAGKRKRKEGWSGAPRR